MNKRYAKSMATENDIYKDMQKNLKVPQKAASGWAGLDKALDWLCAGSESILDFGCGSGSLLFLCAKRGTKKHLGIDLASEAITYAEKRSQMMNCGTYEFKAGSIERLEALAAGCVDGIILSNIIDNMYPDDAEQVLKKCGRILKPNGKLMIKLNPYLSQEELKEGNVQELAKDVYDDGLILWNRKTEDWEKDLNTQFTIAEAYEFYIPEAEQKNRIFLAINK